MVTKFDWTKPYAYERAYMDFTYQVMQLRKTETLDSRSLVKLYRRVN